MEKWREIEVEAGAVAALVSAGYTPLMARLLAIRGVTPGNAAEYFEPSHRALRPPEGLPGVEAAAELVLKHLDAGHRIVVFGDYDCDGICATAILSMTLGALGGRVAALIPERLTEGYGMSDASVARMLSENPDAALVVTVDNGISAVGPVAALKARGIDVIVADHHLPGAELPAADVLVNPKVAAPAHFEGLCGAGVAFLLARALVERVRTAGTYDGPKLAGPLLVLAGLATVTDVMSLRGQNRILVAEALKNFRTCAPVGLRELYDRASRTGAAALTTRDFGFLVGPRLNAAGRLASGRDALDLLLCTDRERARELAQRLDVLNAERKGVEQRMLDAALAELVPGAAAQVLDVADGHEGVSGIVAARVMEQVSAENAKAGLSPVPVCLVVKGRGSARAPTGYNVRDALDACAEFLGSYGGHAAAAGFNVRPGAIAAFRAKFCDACARQAQAFRLSSGAESSAAEAWSAKVDAWVKPADLSLEFVRGLARLEPYGEENPEPVFAMKGQFFADIRQIGGDGRHLHLTFRSNAPRAVWWGHGAQIDELRAAAGTAHDLRFTVTVSDYGEPHVELRLLEIR